MSLTIIHTKRRTRLFLTYDMEWVPGTLEIRIIGVYDGTQYRAYSSVESFLNGELTDKNRGRWFYAHAGGLADIQFVLEAVVKANQRRRNTYQVKASFSGSSAIIVHVRKGRNVWHFVDSYWLLRDKLKNIAKWIGMEKGGVEEKDDPDEEGLEDEEYERRLKAKREWFATVPISELRSYNEGDCIILWRAIHDFECAILQMGGQLQMTLASTAMTLFRRRFLSDEISISPGHNDIARLAYIASRVEVFEREVSDAYYYDINSSFPYAMTHPCPGRHLGTVDRLPLGTQALYLCHAIIESPEIYLPPLPLRIKSRIFFPIGRWEGWFTNTDIELLLREGGRILKLYEVQIYEPFYDLAEYANTLYSKRKASESDFEKIVYKLLLNSLYGKFAECSEKISLLIDPETIRPTMEMLFPGAFLETREAVIPHMHVPISAHITSRARKTLYDCMAICRDFHYCDTDGFSTKERLMTGKELGELKLEKRIEHGYFAAPKLYKMEGQVLKEGIWKDDIVVKGKGFSRLTVSRFMKLLENDCIEFERMSRVRERFRRGFFNPSESTIRKRLSVDKILPKRFTYPDGHTRPWHVSELKGALG